MHQNSKYLKVSDYAKVNVYYHDNKFKLEIPDTHTASELQNYTLPDETLISVMTVKRKEGVNPSYLLI